MALLFPRSCPWRAAGRVRDRAEPGRRGGAGGVLEAACGEPDDQAAGNGSRGPCRGIRLFRCVPMFRCYPGAGSAAGCSHPFACPRPWPGGMGRSASVQAVRRGQSEGALPPGEGRRADYLRDLAPGRGPGG